MGDAARGAGAGTGVGAADAGANPAGGDAIVWVAALRLGAATGCEMGFDGTSRSTVRACGSRDGETAKAGGRAGAVCGRAGVDTDGSSAGRVTVPFRLKSLSSLGPTASLVGVFVVG